MIKHFSLWSPAEYEYVEHLLEQDVRNNSAWNQRYFCLSHQLDEEKEITNEMKRETLNREVEFTLAKIGLCVDNESAWNYLRPLVTRLIQVDTIVGIDAPSYPQSVVDFCMKLWVSSRDEECSPFLLAFLVDYNWFLCNRGVKKTELNEKEKDEMKKLVKSSIELLESLATKFDTIRVNYWNYLISKWKTEFKSFV